jgi:type II secretory pathway component PulK
MQPRYLRHTGHGRRGVLILSVLAGLALASVLLTVWLKLLSLERQEVRAQQSRIQAEYLAEAALGRAWHRLSTDSTYTGETWQVSAEKLNSMQPAEVAIGVERVADDPAAQKITVSARFTGTGTAAVLRSKQRIIYLPTKDQSP